MAAAVGWPGSWSIGEYGNRPSDSSPLAASRPNTRRRRYTLAQLQCSYRLRIFAPRASASLQTSRSLLPVRDGPPPECVMSARVWHSGAQIDGLCPSQAPVAYVLGRGATSYISGSPSTNCFNYSVLNSRLIPLCRTTNTSPNASSSPPPSTSKARMPSRTQLNTSTLWVGPRYWL